MMVVGQVTSVRLPRTKNVTAPWLTRSLTYGKAHSSRGAGQSPRTSASVQATDPGASAA